MKRLWVLLISLIAIGLPLTSSAQQNLSLTVTPPLFRLNIGPGQNWASSIKVVNTNPYDLTVYATVMNFTGQGEDGQGKLTPVTEQDPEVTPYTLASWVSISGDPVVIKREQSADIPFSVSIPQTAAPGGHYAAILVGTQPVGQPSGPSIQISSMISSLLFVDIAGEVREEGFIRELATDKSFYERPEVGFTLRFQNTGTVHVQPQGDITIYNMWGEKRGSIPVNQKTDFGNVLPQSIRKFQFTWNSESGALDIGRFTAVATLTFGKDAHQNINQSVSFWVVPLKPTLITLGVIAVLIMLIVIFIRWYIRKTLRSVSAAASKK